MYWVGQIRHLLLLPLKVLLAVVVYQPLVLALPQGGQVTQGAATIQQVNDTKLNINQSTDRAVINWNSFSIAPQEWVNFQQPSSTSATLNRVTGNTPSSIAGRLTANGQVFLINPNGIAFLPSARVDVAGLVASTLNIQDSDFMRGILRFEQMPGKPPASVVNQGLITVREAGFAALVAPAVQNSGIISARLGKVVLASGTTVSLDFYGDGLLSVTVDPKLAGQITDIYGNKLNSLIDNQGNITAPGGIVTLTAQAAGQIVDNVINVGGIIEAKYAENRNGVIVLSGGQKGTVAVNGTLDVSGEKGGKVEITGENVGLFGTAKIDASGDKGGGLIFVGGDYLGGRADKQRIDPSLNAQNTFVSSQSILTADAKISGNGGEVIVWADNFTRFDGTITATGDTGGFVETSGRNILAVGDTARVDTTGKIGNTGTWLLDPLNLTISGTGTNTNVTGGSPFQPTATGSILRDITINTALASNNVVVKTVGTTGSERGDIVFNNNANVNWSTNKTFTVQAAGQIFMNDGTKVVSSNTGSFNAITFEANTADAVTSNMIGIVLQQGSELSTQGGNISLTGIGGVTGNFNFGILQNKAVVQSTTGSITYKGTGGVGVDGNYGVYILNPMATTGAKIASTSGAISITGTGRGTGDTNAGIVQELGAQVSSTSGAITYTGTGGKGINTNYGIFLSSTNTTINTTGTGTITLTGTGQGTGGNNFGIFQSNAQVSSANGNITYQGTGGNGTSANHGIFLSSTKTTINTTGTGTITLTGTGQGTGGNNFGIVQSGAQVSAVNGAIAYTGTGGKGINTNYGIFLNSTNTTINTTGTGTITLTGKGQGTGTENHGILQKDGAQVTTANGIITYKGTGAGTADGIRTESGSSIIGGNSTKSVVLTSLGNGITLNDVKIQTQENIIITSPGNVIQNNNGGLFATTATKGLQLNGAGNYTLTNANNDIATLAAKNTGNISYRDANGFVVGTVGTLKGISIGTKNVTLEAGGAVTQTQAIIASGLELKGTGATYTLINTANNVTKLAVDTNNNLSFTDANGLIIDTVGSTNGITATNKNVTLTVNAGTITQTKAITASGLELKGNGTFTLTNADNDVTTLAANVGNPLNFTDKNTLTIGTVNATNGITTSNDAVTLKANGLLTINKAIAVGNQKVSIESAGISQGTDGKITGNGLRLLGTGTFTLDNTNNNIALLAANVSGSLTYVDSNVMAVDTVLGTTGVTTTNNPINISTINGNLTVVNTTAANDVDAGTNTVNLTAGGNNIFTNNTNAKITGTGGVTITADRMTLNTGGVINSGTNITTLQPNTAGRLINLGGADVTATTLGLTAAELNTVTAGTLRVGRINSGDVTVSAAIAPAGTSTLSLITNGTVTQNVGATITETNLAIKSGGNITLNQNNQITNFAAKTTANVTLNDLGGLNIDNIDGVDGLVATPTTVDLKTTGNITQSPGANIVSSVSTTLDSGTADINLNNSGNAFTNLKITNANNALVTNLVAFNIQGINATGAVTPNSNGAVTQSGAIIANTLNLQSLGVSYTLGNTSNDISTLNTNNIGTLIYTDANDFSVGNLTTSNENVTLNAPNVNTITFTGNVNTGTGNLTVTSGTINQTGGSITVNGIANFTSTKANTGNVTVKNTGATQLGNSLIGGDFTLTSTGNVTQTGSLKVAGTTTITAPNGLSGLTDPGNVLPSVLDPVTQDLIITGVGTVDLPTKTITGNLTVTANATGSGFASIFSGDAIQLNQNNSFNGTVSFNTQTASLITLSGTPQITQSGVQTVGGTSTFNAVTGTIDLNLNNQLTGAVTLNTGVGGGNINFKNNQATVISSATTGADLAITTTGNLTQTGAVTAGGTTTLNTGASDIILNNVANDFNQLNLTANDAKVTDVSGFNIGSATVTNNLSLTAGDSVSQSGAITANGLELLGDGSFTLENTGNNINTLAGNTTNAISYKDANSFTVDKVNSTNGITSKGTTTLTALNNDTITISKNITNNDPGTSTITVDASKNILVISGAEIKNTSTVTGFDAIVLNANTAGTATGNFGGILLENSKLTTNGGNIKLIGKGGGADSFRYGIAQVNGAQVSSVNGNITYSGTGGNGTSFNYGILLEDTSTRITTTGTGAIVLTGTGNGNGSDNFGILHRLGAQVSSAGGNITYTGTGANGANAIFTQTGTNIIGNNTTGEISFTSTNNPIILNNAEVKTTNNILITSAGDVIQNDNGGLFANGLELLGTGAYDLANTANDINTLAANTTNSIKFTDTNGFDIGTVNSTSGVNVGANNLTLKAGNTVTQSQKITANGIELLGAGAYDLTNTANDINTLAANTTNNINFTDTNGFDIGTVNSTSGVNVTASKNLTLNAGDTVTQSQVIIANGLELLGAGAYDLTNTANDINTLAANTTNSINYRDTNSFEVGTVNSTNGINSKGTTTLTALNNGTITINKNITNNDPGTSTITVDADKNIFVNSGVEVKNTSTVTGFDAIVFNANTAGTATGTFVGIDLDEATLTTNGGNIKLTGKGGDTGLFNVGILQQSGAQVNSSNGSITYTGTGGNGTKFNYGILLQDNNTTITTTGMGAISLTGTGGNGTDVLNVGILQQSGVQVSSGDGKITYTGTGGNGTDDNYGIVLAGTGTKITTTGTGAIDLTGTGNGTGGNNYGIYQLFSAQVGSVDGSITYQGTGGNGTDFNYGIVLSGTDTKTTTTTGDIQFTGTGQGSTSDNIGILQADGAQVSSTNGNITYQGTGGNGTFLNHGIILREANTKITTTGTGAISLTGTGGNGTGLANIGIYQLLSAQVSTQGGNITYKGTGGNGTDGNYGIAILSTDTKITTTTGAINLTGTGNGAGGDNYGIYQLFSAQVGSVDGNITYIGTGNNGADAIRTEFNSNIIGNNTTGKISFTSTNNPITLNNVEVKTTNNILITSPGDVTQNNQGGLFADGLQLNGAGNYTLTNPNNDANKLAANTNKNIKYTDVNGFEIASVVTNGINTKGDVTLQAGGTVTQSQVIIANGLALLGTGKFELKNPGNTINTIAADTTNDISFVNSQTLTVGVVNPTGITTTGTVFLQTVDGDIILNNSVSSTATGDAITLVADDNFINNVAGKGALSATNGRWLVYATSPVGNVNGWPVLGGSQQFKTTYPQIALFKGNGFLYTVRAPFVPDLPVIPTEPVTFTLNFNDRQWRDFAQFSEQSALVESLVCTSDTALASSPANDNDSDETLIILSQSENPLALTQRVFFVNDGLPQCQSDNQASK